MDGIARHKSLAALRESLMKAIRNHCRHQDPVLLAMYSRTIQTLAALHPEILLMTHDSGSDGSESNENDNGNSAQCSSSGRTPLHSACDWFRSSSPDAILLLLEACPEALEVMDKFGSTPLHYACRRRLPLDIILAMAKKLPKALTIGNSFGATPLHVECFNCNNSNDGDRNVLLPLAEACPEALGIVNNDGKTPLHIAMTAISPLLEETVLSLIRLFPQALSVVGKDGSTVLHAACKRPNVSNELLRYIVELWPVACLFVDSIQESPLEVLMRRRPNGNENVVYLQQCTDWAVGALVEMARNERCSLPEGVVVHVGETSRARSSQERKGRRYDILHHEELQKLLLGQDYQRLITAIIRMKKAGRESFLGDPGNKALSLNLLAAVSDNLDGLFWHLSEAACLFKERRWVEDQGVRCCVEAPSASRKRKASALLPSDP